MLVIWKALLTNGSNTDWLKLSFHTSLLPFTWFGPNRRWISCGSLSHVEENIHLIFKLPSFLIFSVINWTASISYHKGKWKGVSEGHTFGDWIPQFDGKVNRMDVHPIVKQTGQLIGPQKTVHHVYSIPPDGLWLIQADIGLWATALKIRLALTLNVQEACKPGPISISPGCVTHFLTKLQHTSHFSLD